MKMEAQQKAELIMVEELNSNRYIYCRISTR